MEQSRVSLYPDLCKLIGFIGIDKMVKVSYISSFILYIKVVPIILFG